MSGRTKFMLDALMAIKNNNVKKLPNYDPSYQVHLHKIMKTFLRPGADTTPLNVKLEDLLSAETRGRWWIVGNVLIPGYFEFPGIIVRDFPRKPGNKGNY